MGLTGAIPGCCPLIYTASALLKQAHVRAFYVLPLNSSANTVVPAQLATVRASPFPLTYPPDELADFTIDAAWPMLSSYSNSVVTRFHSSAKVGRREGPPGHQATAGPTAMVAVVQGAGNPFPLPAALLAHTSLPTRTCLPARPRDVGRAPAALGTSQDPPPSSTQPAPRAAAVPQRGSSSGSKRRQRGRGRQRRRWRRGRERLGGCWWPLRARPRRYGAVHCGGGSRGSRGGRRGEGAVGGCGFGSGPPGG